MDHLLNIFQQQGNIIRFGSIREDIVERLLVLFEGMLS